MNLRTLLIQKKQKKIRMAALLLAIGTMAPVISVQAQTSNLYDIVNEEEAETEAVSGSAAENYVYQEGTADSSVTDADEQSSSAVSGSSSGTDGSGNIGTTVKAHAVSIWKKNLVNVCVILTLIIILGILLIKNNKIAKERK